MTRPAALRALRSIALILACALPAAAAAPPAPAAAPGAPAPARRPGPDRAAAPPPRLVVLIVVDMFPADVLDRSRDRLGQGGFRRLVGGGALFTDCAYTHAVTDTAPGHASIATGTTPDRHGIVGNQWYDPGLGRMIGAAEDPDVLLVGAATDRPGVSPRHLVGDTFADEVRLATGGRGRSIGIAEKARAAVLMAGRGANGAWFYDQATGRMVTSRHYVPAMPGWAAAFNGRAPADRYYSRGFAAGGTTLVAPGPPGTAPGREFYAALPGTPWIDEMLLDFARAAIAGEGLGGDDDTDVLAIGLSGHDYVGHDHGPHAPAFAAMTAAADKALAGFLRHLDERVGRDRYWVALTADHGAAPTLEACRRAGIDAPGYDGALVRRAIGGALAARYGDADPLRLLGEGTRIWFDPAGLARHRATAAEAARIAGPAAAAVAGIAGWVAGDDSNMDEATVAAYRRSTFRGRSPDLHLVRAPFAIDRSLVASDHGSPWSYDARVPLVLHGPPFRPGLYRQRAAPIDLAPTLADALGTAPPAQATGRVLAEAFR